MDASLYTWNFIWNLTAILDIGLDKPHNMFKRDTEITIKKRFVWLNALYPPEDGGSQNFCQNLFKFFYTQSRGYYCFPVIFSSERLKAGLNILKEKKVKCILFSNDVKVPPP